MYKKFRLMLRTIFDLTNEKRKKQQKGFLRDFNDRKLPDLKIFKQKITF